MSKDVLIRNVPDELLEEVNHFARENAGPGGKPSRDAALQHLIRRGLGVARGEVGSGGTKREA